MSDYDAKREYIQRMFRGETSGHMNATSFVNEVRLRFKGLTNPMESLVPPSPEQLKEFGMEDTLQPQPNTTPPEPGNIMVVQKAYYDLVRQAQAFGLVAKIENDKVKNFTTVSQLIESIFLLHASLGQVLDVLHFLDKQTTGLLEQEKRMKMNAMTGPYPVVHDTGMLAMSMDSEAMKAIEDRVIEKFMKRMQEEQKKQTGQE